MNHYKTLNPTVKALAAAYSIVGEAALTEIPGKRLMWRPEMPPLDWVMK